MRAMVAAVPSVNGRMRWHPRGMGQDDDSTDYESDQAQTTTTDTTDTGEIALNTSPINVPCTSNCGTTSTSTSSGTSVASAISSITGAFTNIYKAIAGPLPAGCTQVSTVYGTSTQCVGANGQPTLSTSLTSLVSGSGGILLIGGALLLVMLMAEKK